MVRHVLLWNLAVLMTQTAGMQVAGPPHGDIESNCLLQLLVEDARRNASSASSTSNSTTKSTAKSTTKSTTKSANVTVSYVTTITTAGVPGGEAAGVSNVTGMTLEAYAAEQVQPPTGYFIEEGGICRNKDLNGEWDVGTFGGFCAKTNTPKDECRSSCDGYAGCLAASWYGDCHLFTGGLAAPGDCPAGWSASAGQDAGGTPDMGAYYASAYQTYAAPTAYCLVKAWQTLISEPAGVAGVLAGGLAAFGPYCGAAVPVRIEWGAGSFIEFTTAGGCIFVDRNGTAVGAKSDNQIIEIGSLSTSDSSLSSWVASAGGAILCMGTMGAWDTAWAILPADNGEWGVGCNGGGWAGRGAYYGDTHYGAGWVGVKDTLEAKAFVSNVVGMALKVRAAPGPCEGVALGDRFLQVGEWRVGEAAPYGAWDHLSVCHRDGQTAQIYRSGGTLHPGPRTTYGLWDRPVSSPSNVSLGDGFLQFGHFRLGAVDSNHLSVAHEDGQTVQIFRSDGQLHPGPRTDWNTYGNPVAQASSTVEELAWAEGLACGHRFVQFGSTWRIGEIVSSTGSSHLSVSYLNPDSSLEGQTPQIFNQDGTRQPGPRTDYSTWDRPLPTTTTTTTLTSVTRVTFTLSWWHR